MRKITNAAEIINKLMPENDKILFNLFYRIAEGENTFWVTDDESYLAGQTNEDLPLWIWIKDTSKDSTKAELKKLLSERLAENPKLKITADEAMIKEILDQTSQEKKISYEVYDRMNVYACRQVTNTKKASGHAVLSNESHKPVLEKFITGMVNDLEHRPMGEGEAEGFAASVAGSDDLFLWEDAGSIVSMAMITHRTEKYARINTVYTDSDRRGKGYAEKDYVCSNAAYKRIGYTLCGELGQFQFL